MTVAALRPAALPPAASRNVSLIEIVRPFLLLGALAFLAGFGGYLILGPPNVMAAGDAKPTAASSAMTPASASAGDWNAPKQI